MKSLKDFNYLLSLDRRYTKTESEIFRFLHEKVRVWKLAETQADSRRALRSSRTRRFF